MAKAKGIRYPLSQADLVDRVQKHMSKVARAASQQAGSIPASEMWRLAGMESLAQNLGVDCRCGPEVSKDGKVIRPENMLCACWEVSRSRLATLSGKRKRQTRRRKKR